MNYYEHHLGDYAEATAHLSFLEDAAYSRLMRKVYATELALPIDLKAIQRLVGARTKDEREAVANVLGEFFELRDDGWHNARCDVEIDRFHDKQRKAKASADARWANTARNANASEKHATAPVNGHASADALAMRTHSEGNAPRARTSLQTPSTKHQTPSTNLENSEPEGSGGKSPPTPGEIIFGLGLPLLISASVPEKNARSMLGLMRKTHGDESLIAALQRCAEERPLEPVAWLQATLKTRPKPNSDAAVRERNASSNAEAKRLLGIGEFHA